MKRLSAPVAYALSLKGKERTKYIKDLGDVLCEMGRREREAIELNQIMDLIIRSWFKTFICCILGEP